VRPRFQADAGLNEDIVTGVVRREPGVDFQTSEETGLRGLEDRQVLARAASEGRIVVTHARRTMPKHFAEFILAETSPGLFVVSQKADVLLILLCQKFLASQVYTWFDM
jgi:hypothetical protein